MDKYIGRLLDNRYEILEVIGTGGMAVVYKAMCHRLNRLVAIKILKDEYSQDAEFRRRFHAESQAVAMLSHPNIVSVYDVSHSGDTDYIVMELIDGITLKQYMEQKGMLNWREVLHFSTQIAKALEHAHSRGIVHRDIKPHNIMILKDGSVKVADFGIARITSAQSTLTREALGSVHYISPEQARGSRVDNRSDLYSLGVVMYEMLTGRPPFDGDSPVAVAIQHINAKPVMPAELNPAVPKGLEQITMHAMTAAIDKRYDSATQMLSDLEEFRKNPNILFDFSAQAESAPASVPQISRPAEHMSQAERAAHPEMRPQRRQPEPEPEKKKGNQAAVIAGVICIVLAVFGICYFLYNFILKDLFSKTKDVQVPQFVGEQYDSIDPEDWPDFEIIVENWINDDTASYGEVLNQDPAAGSTVKSGTKVKLTVSLGQETDTMPNVVGYTSSNAENVLNSMKVKVTVQTQLENNDDVEADKVISTDPVSGVTLKSGQVVTLTVSKGPAEEPCEVPELVGLEVTEAIQQIEAAGLKKGNITYVESDLPKDTVTFQSLDQGEQVKKGTIINLQASLGPPETESETTETETDSGNTQPEDTQPEDTTAIEPTKTEKIVEIKLPEGEGTVTVSLRLDGASYGQPFNVDCSRGTISVSVEGSGVQKLDIYFDGVLNETKTIDFGG